MRMPLIKSNSYARLPQHIDFQNRPVHPIRCLRTFVTPLHKTAAHLTPRNQLSLQSSSSAACRWQNNNHAVPLDRSWGGEVPDWELEEYDSEQEIENELEASVLSPESGGGGGGGGEFAFQNVLAAVLLGALALSMGNILLKLGVVAFALISAAFRYTSIAFLVIVLLALFS
jgi:hypothetical protein